MSEYNPFAAPAMGDYARETFPSRTYGGITRLPYFGYSLLIGIVSNVLQFAVAEANAGGLILVIALVGLVFNLWIVAQRLTNIGLSGWWVLGLIVPLLNIWVAVQCIAAPEGYADHKTLDTAGKTIIGLILGAFVLMIVFVVVASSMR